MLPMILLSTEAQKTTIGKHHFSIVIEGYNLYNSKGDVMKLYREENGTSTYILGVTLHDNTGTCSDKSIQKGAYEINGTSIILYSFWDRSGPEYNAPYGARVQKYEVLNDGTVDLKESRVYIESDIKNFDLDTGMQYLFNAPHTDVEKKIFKEYITEMERAYKGTFIFNKDAKILINTVHDALKRATKNRWK